MYLLIKCDAAYEVDLFHIRVPPSIIENFIIYCIVYDASQRHDGYYIDPPQNKDNIEIQYHTRNIFQKRNTRIIKQYHALFINHWKSGDSFHFPIN